jgi:acyl carrier protein
MTQKEVKSAVLEIIHLIMDNKNIELSAKVADIAFDSLRFIKLVVEIEKKFKIKFDDDYLLLHKYKTIADICEYVASKIA